MVWLWAAGAAVPGYSATKTADTAPAIDEKAMAILTRMAETVAGAERFAVTMRDGYDVVQDTGEKIEFGDILKITVNRPEQMRVEITESNMDTGTILFDGKAISVYSQKEKAYAAAQQPGGLDDSVPYFVSELQMRFPLARLFVSSFPDYLKEEMESVRYVESTTITGVPCDHIAGRVDTVDFQAWISQGEKPLLQRVVITYRNDKGQPQFWSDFSDWNFSPEVSGAIFTLTPPEGTERIRFLTEIPKPSAKAKQKKGGKK
jgi:hypothetical protein